MNHETLIVALAVLAGIGVLTAITFTRRTSRRAVRGIREATRVGGTITRAVVGGAVIIGLELAVALSVHDWRILLGVFAGPALMAGATFARMFAVTEFVRTGRGFRR